MTAFVQQVTYLNTGDTAESCLIDAREFFQKLEVLRDENFAGFTEASVKINIEGKGDGKRWRGRFIYDQREIA